MPLLPGARAMPLSNSRIAWFNGAYVPERDVVVPFRDRSWKYGDGWRLNTNLERQRG
jgi:hypothetical protein